MTVDGARRGQGFQMEGSEHGSASGKAAVSRSRLQEPESSRCRSPQTVNHVTFAESRNSDHDGRQTKHAEGLETLERASWEVVGR